MQVDVGCSGGNNHVNHFQLRCFVLLLFCHLPIWTMVEDVPQQRLGLPSYPGMLHVQLPFHVTYRTPVFELITVTPIAMVGPQWFGSVHYMDHHRLTYQFCTGSPLVGSGPQHRSHSFSVHPLWRGGYMVRVLKYLLFRFCDQWSHEFVRRCIFFPVGLSWRTGFWIVGFETS